MGANLEDLEQCFECFIIENDDTSPEEEFQVSEVSNEEKNTIIGENEYLRDLINSRGLEILKKNLVQRAYEDRNEKGLFHLFLNQSCLEGIQVWTNAELLRKVKKKVSKEIFNAYIGLELAMSIVHLNDMHDYWSTKMFLGNDDIKRIMSQDRFTEICSSLNFYPEYDHAVAVVDPLWHSRIMLHHFMKNAASVAVPKGCSALDDNTICCKGCTGARPYVKSKAVKFGIRFYAVVGWKHAYIHSLWDNGSGNKTNVPPAQPYCTVFLRFAWAI